MMRNFKLLSLRFALSFISAIVLSSETIAQGAVQEEIVEKTEMKRIAYSSKKGVEVFAQTQNAKWCTQIPELKIFAQNENAFSDSQLSDLMNKVGVVLESDCPQIEAVSIDGYKNNTLIYRGQASKEGRWKPENGDLKTKIRRLQVSINNTKKSNGTSKISATVEKSALETRIYSKNKSCSIMYTSTVEPDRLKDWTIAVGNNSCSDNLIYGKAEVSVFDENGRFVEALDGFFTEGRWTGRKNLNVVMLNRYGFGPDNQIISYIIDTNSELDIHYIGYLHTKYNKKTNRYSAWTACNPLVITAATENEHIFLNKTVTNDIIRSAQSYADVVCSGSTKLKFFATTVAQGIAGMDLPEDFEGTDEKAEESVIYFANLDRKIGQKWKIVEDKKNNLARMRQLEKRNNELREHQLMMADYNDLLKSDYLGRLAYLFNVDRIDIFPNMVLASQLTGKAVHVNIMARINKAGLKNAVADWPRPFLLQRIGGLIQAPGWYLLSGDLRLSKSDEVRKYISTIPNEEQKDVSGLMTLELSSAMQCDSELCGEATDLIGLVRRRFEQPNWKPYLSEDNGDQENE